MLTTPNPNSLSSITAVTFPSNLVTQAGKIKCRFDCFVRLRPNVKPFFPGGKDVFCYRGDKFTDHPPKMLSKLLKLIEKRVHMCAVIVLNDNPKPDEERIIVKILNGIVEINHLAEYSKMINLEKLPDLLQPSSTFLGR